MTTTTTMAQARRRSRHGREVRLRGRWRGHRSRGLHARRLSHSGRKPAPAELKVRVLAVVFLLVVLPKSLLNHGLVFGLIASHPTVGQMLPPAAGEVPDIPVQVFIRPLETLVPDPPTFGPMLDTTALRIVVGNPAIVMVQGHATVGVVMDLGPRRGLNMSHFVTVGMGVDRGAMRQMTRADFSVLPIHHHHLAVLVMVSHLTIGMVMGEPAVGMMMQDASIMQPFDVENLMAMRMNMSALRVAHPATGKNVLALGLGVRGVMGAFVSGFNRLRVSARTIDAAGRTLWLLGASMKSEFARKMRSPEVFSIL